MNHRPITGPSTYPPQVEFGLLIEAGTLEAQALLLCDSIRRFAGRHATAPITAVSPRAERRPSRATLLGLEALQVRYVELDIESPAPEYGVSFRVFSLAWLAAQPGPPLLVQLDSDTIFVEEPNLSLDGHGVAARPVDGIGMCSTGPDDPRDALWRRMCDVCGIDVEALPFIETTIGRQTVRASYNGGLIAAQRDIFADVEAAFRAIVAAEIRPFAESGRTLRSGVEIVSAAGFEYWGTSQAAISIALAKLGRTTRLLPPAYNIPLHVFSQLEPLRDQPVHLHYHWLFGEPDEPNPLLDGRLALPAVQDAWLRRKLPL